jgi:hypothetical protein
MSDDGALTGASAAGMHSVLGPRVPRRLPCRCLPAEVAA